ncbi:MAG TPA: hypothetical protein PK765_03345 [bacterium]|nr:hypothetical protein [bacterium]
MTNPDMMRSANDTAEKLQSTADRNRDAITTAIETTKNSGLLTRESTADTALMSANNALRQEVDAKINLVKINLEAGNQVAAERLRRDLEALFVQQHEMKDLVLQGNDADEVREKIAENQEARRQTLAEDKGTESSEGSEGVDMQA